MARMCSMELSDYYLGNLHVVHMEYCYFNNREVTYTTRAGQCFPIEGMMYDGAIVHHGNKCKPMVRP